MEKDNTYKKHILDFIADIDSYTQGLDYEQFLDNKMAQDAVVRKLEIIGEAAKRLSPEFKKQVPGVPWKDIAGTRDILAHDYIAVDFKEVWQIIKKDLPQLKKSLKS